MNIAFVTAEYPPYIYGGAGFYAKQLIRNLAQRGHNITVFLPKDVSTNGGTSDSGAGLKIQVVAPSHSASVGSTPIFWLKLPSLMKSVNQQSSFDLIHFNGYPYFNPLQLRPLKCPIISTIHHLNADLYSSQIKNPGYRFLHPLSEYGYVGTFIERSIINSSNRLISVSDYTKKRVVSVYGIEEDVISTIHHGMDIPHLDIKNDEILTLKKQTFNGYQYCLLFIGRINDYRKGLDVLIEAFSKIILKHKCCLIIVGKGDNGPIISLAKKHGVDNNIIFFDWVDEKTLIKLFHISDIYVLPSRLEGYGLTIPEAMACGTPIIATRVGAIPELMNNKNGVLVDPDNINDLVSAINMLLGDSALINEMKSNNLKSARSFSNWSTVAEKVEKQYHLLLS